MPEKPTDLDSAGYKSLSTLPVCLYFLYDFESEFPLNMVVNAADEDRLRLSCGNHSDNNAKPYGTVWPPQRRSFWQRSQAVISRHTKPDFCLLKWEKTHNPVTDQIYNISKHNIP